jgi:hypothetical protein
MCADPLYCRALNHTHTPPLRFPPIRSSCEWLYSSLIIRSVLKKRVYPSHMHNTFFFVFYTCARNMD